MEINSENKGKVMAIGTVLGAIVGMGTAIALARAADNEENGRIEIDRGDLFKAGTVLVGALRTVSSLGRGA